ncbi:MAG: hypothetical protein K9N62_12815 [Verrucomicrobia bacterium]|nr:hypothetical protein [Verrucomicrobiota bacterium]
MAVKHHLDELHLVGLPLDSGLEIRTFDTLILQRPQRTFQSMALVNQLQLPTYVATTGIR